MLSSLLLYLVLTTAISEIEALSIYACSGESVRLFQNISINVSRNDTYLYKNSTLIERWPKSKAEQEEERLSYDDNGNIWMSSITISDDETYTFLQNKDDNVFRTIYEVRLNVLVAPDKSCIPKLKRDGNTLIASLETGAVCGKSGVTVSWLDHPYLALENLAKAKLSPGKKAGTYYACIETPALSCAGPYKPKDFCSSLTIDESNDHIDTATVIIVISAMNSVLLIIIITVAAFWIQQIKKQRQPKSNNQKQDGMIELSSLLNPPIEDMPNRP